MKNKLIVALDVNSFEKARKLVDKLTPYVNIFKVGSELFVSSGPKIIDYINKKRRKVFLDLKFYDIPNTVKGTTLAAAEHNVFMLTLHASGGSEMLKAAKEALTSKRKRPLLVGVTVLTSVGTENAAREVIKLAKLAKKSGLDGIVCSPKETKNVKKACGKNFLVVNPGIRPSSAARGDQKRIATPEEAIKNGADFIVIGRPITVAKNPVEAVRTVIAPCRRRRRKAAGRRRGCEA